MHDVLGYIAMVWSILLLGWVVVLIIRPSPVPQRIAALDLIALLLVALLTLFSQLRDVVYFLDAALAVALLAFVGTIGYARYHASGRLFR
ncbi:MAG TPA: monovalent cation/H+ antiporter complex subunit F [Thermoleophilaceae bacterium]|nr:monovalent cation/H+ antiporter complex subunit F [Thermoleophilaceae bacterium]